MESMWRRLRERRMVQWTVAYLAGAWLLMQVLHLIGEQFGIPVGLLRSVTAVLGVGVLAALVLAWYHGEQGSQRVSGAELLMLGAILVIAASAVAMVRKPLAPGQALASELVGSAADLRPFPVAREKSIAVLPFVNLSDERQDEHFSDGLTEELLVDLARITNLRVISRTSVMRYKDAQLGVREIGDELGVGHVVTGSVRRVGDRVRIIAQLIDARTDQHIWADSYDSDWHDLLAVQRQISSNIVASLRAALPTVDVAAGVPAAAHTVSGQAYQLYLQGKYHFHNRFAAGSSTIPGLSRSADLLGQAVAADPSFARAWAALALTCAHLAGASRGSEEREWAARAQTALAQAIALDPRAADAYVARGMIHAHRLRWPEAERSFLLALQSEPQNASAHDWYGTLLVSAGRSQEAERILRRSAEIDPINARTLHWLADALRNSGRLEESLLQAQRSVDLGMPASAIAVYIYHIQRREWEAAIASEEASLRGRGMEPGFVRPLVDAIRDRRRIPAAVAKAAAVADTTPALLHMLPSFYYDLAEADHAFDAVDAMIPDGNGLYALWRMWEPQFTHLRNHPRFRDLARRMGLVEYWREFGWPDLCRPEGDSFVCR
jgi:TolB-like protein